MVLAGVYGKREIGTSMIGAHPGTVEGDPRSGGTADTFCPSHILNHINQRLAGFGVPDGMLGVFVLNVEAHFFWTASGLSGGDCSRILGKGGRVEREKEECENAPGELAYRLVSSLATTPSLM